MTRTVYQPPEIYRLFTYSPNIVEVSHVIINTMIFLVFGSDKVFSPFYRLFVFLMSFSCVFVSENTVFFDLNYSFKSHRKCQVFSN